MYRFGGLLCVYSPPSQETKPPTPPFKISDGSKHAFRLDSWIPGLSCCCTDFFLYHWQELFSWGYIRLWHDVIRLSGFVSEGSEYDFPMLYERTASYGKCDN